MDHGNQLNSYSNAKPTDEIPPEMSGWTNDDPIC